MRAPEFLALFTRVKKNGSHDWHVPCPAHDDNQADPAKFSLHVTEQADRLLVICFAGCPVENVMGAMFLPVSALFYEERTGQPAPVVAPPARAPRVRRAPLPAVAVSEPESPPEPMPTLAAFAALKQLPEALLTFEGWHERGEALAIPYQQRNGDLFRLRLRTSLRPGSGFKWAGASGGVIPYGRHRLDEAMDHGELWLVEGESDTLTAWHHSLPCLGLPGSSTTECLAAEDVAGITALWIVQEPGRGGDTFARGLRKRLRALGWRGTARLVRLPVKDLSELHLASPLPGAFARAIEDAKQSAVDLETWQDPDEPPPSPPPPPDTRADRRTPRSPAGFIEKYVAAVSQRTDAPIEAHQATAITILSALAGSKVRLHLSYRPGGASLVLWTMNLVDSTSGRKTTTMQLGLDVIRAVLGESAVLAWKASPEAFIQALAERDNQASVYPRDEYTGLLTLIKKGGYVAGLSQDMIRAFDGLPISIARTAKMNRKTGVRVDDTDRVQNPYLVKLCAATRTSFIETATIDDVLDGLLARFIFTSGTAEERPMRMATDAMEQEWTDVKRHAQAFHDRASELVRVNIPEWAFTREWELETAWKEIAKQSPRPDACMPHMKRLAEAVLKVAALLAIDRSVGGSATISEADFNDAVALAGPWQRTGVELINDLGRSRFKASCDAVRRTVETRKAVSSRELHRAHQDLRGRDFDEIARALIDQGYIHVVQGERAENGGRPPMLYLAGPEPEATRNGHGHA